MDTKQNVTEFWKITHRRPYQLERLQNVKFTIVPVVIGALGSFTSSLLLYLKQLPGKHPINPLTKGCILGNCSHPAEPCSYIYLVCMQCELTARIILIMAF